MGGVGKVGGGGAFADALIFFSLHFSLIKQRKVEKPLSNTRK
jgi:hypothetical protein